MEGFYVGEAVQIPHGPTTHEMFYFFDDGKVISANFNSRTPPTAPPDWLTRENEGKMIKDGNWGGGMGLEYWTMVSSGNYLKAGPFLFIRVTGTTDKGEWNAYIFNSRINKDGTFTTTRIIVETPANILEDDVRRYRPIDYKPD